MLNGYHHNTHLRAIRSRPSVREFQPLQSGSTACSHTNKHMPLDFPNFFVVRPEPVLAKDGCLPCTRKRRRIAKRAAFSSSFLPHIPIFRNRECLQKRRCFQVFPMCVPRLSWQIFDCSTKMASQKTFPAPRRRPCSICAAAPRHRRAPPCVPPAENAFLLK